MCSTPALLESAGDSAVEYLMSKEGGGAKHGFCSAPTTSIRARPTDPARVPEVKGVKDTDIDEEYTPFGHSDYQTIVADIKKFSAGARPRSCRRQWRFQRAVLQGTG
jgi:hypothetical protein